MKKILYFFIIFTFSTSALAHVLHYKDIKKIEMQIFKDGKKIGDCIYDFDYNGNFLKVHNKTNFQLKILNLKVFSVLSEGTEIYKENQLISFESRTLQNEKEKYVNLKFSEKENVYIVDGSSYKGKADKKSIIGNWWNHKLLESESQISPLSGSVKKQVVNFVKKEKIYINGNEYIAHKFKLKSKGANIDENKKLNFDIWFDPKQKLILKVGYDRMGYWEYSLKKITKN